MEIKKRSRVLNSGVQHKTLSIVNTIQINKINPLSINLGV